jgi:tripartite-type tricarboxylate transporter receptor subunit TctC
MFQPWNRRLAITAFICTLASSAAHAQGQTIKVIVPFPAGGFIDTVARTFSQTIAMDLNVPMIIENRLGAGGKIAEEYAAAAPPDGQTLLINLVLRPTLTATIPPDPNEMDMMKSFAIIGSLASTPLFMSAPPSLGVKDFPGLIAKIKAEPGKHSYGSPGPGTPSQIVSAMIVKQFGLDIAHVPYRGASAAVADLTSGILAWVIDTPGGAGALVEAGKVTPMFVSSSARIRQLPEVPTLIELGYPQFADQLSTVFLMAPAATPLPILQKLNLAVAKAQKNQAVQTALDNLRLIPGPADQTLYQARTAAADQIAKWTDSIKTAGE